jgi:hypothetical protein
MTSGLAENEDGIIDGFPQPTSYPNNDGRISRVAASAAELAGGVSNQGSRSLSD